MAVITLLVLWPSSPPTVEAPVREAPQSPAQTGIPVPAPAKAAGTVGEKSQAVEAASAARETAPVARESQAPGVAALGVQGGMHKVERGESLWAIAARWYSDARLWPRIFRANRERIPNPDLIHPGLQITVPPLQ